jgi:hypothetical protein
MNQLDEKSLVQQFCDCIRDSVSLTMEAFKLKKEGIPEEKLAILYEKINLCETQRDILVNRIKQSKQVKE